MFKDKSCTKLVAAFKDKKGGVYFVAEAQKLIPSKPPPHL
jgi:hypothetical protein